LSHILTCASLEGATRRYALQRLFSTFPGGQPGLGLLLLRTSVGLIGAAEGIFFLTDSTAPFLVRWLIGPALTAGGACLTIGFLTPYAGLATGFCFLGIALSWISGPSSGVHDTRLLALEIAISAVAIVLLGPGAYSVDGLLFGRREIVIPPATRSSEL
jgi:uncharacterized membrane protein YphA (DoxX/SURF4 family)